MNTPHPAERMADDMREIDAVSGGVTPADLEQRGWKPGEIARHGEAARRRAQKLSTTRH